MYKHDAIVRAWLDGKQIQVRDEPSELWRDYPETDSGVVPAFPPHREFRIKPEPKKTVGYKRYIYHKICGTFGIAISQEKDIYRPDALEDFVKWIDTEWQYEEFYE